MENKITPARLAAYAQRVARRVGETAFAQKAALDGPALQTLTAVRSLNLLVLHGLFGQWQTEARQMRSPYFDYEAPAVQQALAGLLNTLSRHIRVERATLEQLVEQAVIDVVGLATDPAATYERRFLLTGGASGTVTPDVLRADLKFVGINKELFSDFLDSLPPAPLERPTVATRLGLHIRAHYKEATTPDTLLTELSQLVPVTLAELHEAAPPASKPTAPAPAAPAPAPPPAPVATPKAEPVPAAKAPAPAEPLAKPVAPTPAAPAPPAFQPLVTPAAAPAPTPAPAPKPAVSEPLGVSPATPLHEKLRVERSTLNDQLRHKEQPGLAEVMESKAKVESLEKAITINQRFTLINELFDGDREGYAAAIRQLDSLPTLEQARAYIMGGQMSAGHQWADKDEHVQRLLKLVERKFA